MSENDPWKSWYQEPPPPAPPSADRTVSMPQPSNRPTFEPNPGSGGGYGGGGYGGGGYGGGAGGGGGGGGGRGGAAPPGLPPREAPGCGAPPRRGGHLLVGQREAEPEGGTARHNPHLGRDELADRRVRPADRDQPDRTGS